MDLKIKSKWTEDQIIALAGFGTFLTIVGTGLGAAEITEDVVDVVDNVVDGAGNVIEKVSKVPKSVYRVLGGGRPGGLL